MFAFIKCVFREHEKTHTEYRTIPGVDYNLSDVRDVCRCGKVMKDWHRLPAYFYDPDNKRYMKHREEHLKMLRELYEQKDDRM